jgi:hypothetical protein
VEVMNKLGIQSGGDCEDQAQKHVITLPLDGKDKAFDLVVNPQYQNAAIKADITNGRHEGDHDCRVAQAEMPGNVKSYGDTISLSKFQRFYGLQKYCGRKGSKAIIKASSQSLQEGWNERQSDTKAAINVAAGRNYEKESKVAAMTCDNDCEEGKTPVHQQADAKKEKRELDDRTQRGTIPPIDAVKAKQMAAICKTKEIVTHKLHQRMQTHAQQNNERSHERPKQIRFPKIQPRVHKPVRIDVSRGLVLNEDEVTDIVAGNWPQMKTVVSTSQIKFQQRGKARCSDIYGCSNSKVKCRMRHTASAPRTVEVEVSDSQSNQQYKALESGLCLTIPDSGAPHGEPFYNVSQISQAPTVVKVDVDAQRDNCHGRGRPDDAEENSDYTQRQISSLGPFPSEVGTPDPK